MADEIAYEIKFPEGDLVVTPRTEDDIKNIQQLMTAGQLITGYDELKDKDK